MISRFSPPTIETQQVDISTMRTQCFDQELLAGGGPSLSTWPTTNLAIYAPLYVRAGVAVTNVYWINGTTAAGNLDVAVYDEQGKNKLIATGTQAQTGTSTIQSVTVTPPVFLPPGRYWMGMVVATTGATYYRAANQISMSGFNHVMSAATQSLASAVMPATITFATSSVDYIPMMGLNCLTVSI